MFGNTINICSSIIVIAATVTISLAFLFIICILFKKCVDLFDSRIFNIIMGNNHLILKEENTMINKLRRNSFYG